MGILTENGEQIWIGMFNKDVDEKALCPQTFVYI